jgi:sigma-B regulation protein RsbU (phosphoserine phosphatase)
LRSTWDFLLIVACVTAALTTLATGESSAFLIHLASGGVLVMTFIWYWLREVRAPSEEFRKLRAAALAVQVLWLSVLYSQTASLLPVPDGLREPLAALLLATGTVALSVSVLVAMDLAVIRLRYRASLLAVGYASVIACTLLGTAFVPVLGFSGVTLGLLAPMGWLITLDRRQRISVLVGGVLSTIPLIAAASIFTLTPESPWALLTGYVRLGSVFCLLYVVLLLVRAAQAMSAATLYERKVQELDAVYDFGLTARTALNPQEFHKAILRSLHRISSPDVAAVVEPAPDGEGSVSSLLRVDADGEHLYRNSSRSPWATLAEQFSDRRPLLVADHTKSQPGALRRIWEPGRGSSVSVPVLSPEGDPRALLIAGRHQEHAFPQPEIHSISGFASQVGLAMEHARLMREMVESERRKRELEIARQMQLALLPSKPPAIHSLDIADRSIPATEVGGDYFDYLELPDDRFGVVFGDVAGHGMTAGLIMAMAKSAVHTQVRADGTATRLLPRLGEVLLEMSAPNQYMTMVFAQIDVQNGKLWYVNAGHHYPLHFKAAEGKIDKLESTGPPLGLLPLPPGEPRESTMRKGDVLAFYSDGLVEAINSDEEEFGITRLAQVVVDNVEQPAAVIVEEIFAAVERFCARRQWHDDASLVVVRMT